MHYGDCELYSQYGQSRKFDRLATAPLDSDDDEYIPGRW